MLKKLVLYGVGIYIVGLVFSGITYALLDFTPYFVAGMVLTVPYYGAYCKRAKNAKHLRKHNSFVLHFQKWLKKIIDLNKNSITCYLILLVVVLNTYEYIGEVLGSVLKAGFISFILSFVLWEVTRFALKTFKKVQMMSYMEAVKGAF